MKRSMQNFVKCLKKMDKDMSGTISKEELKTIVEKVGLVGLYWYRNIQGLQLRLKHGALTTVENQTLSCSLLLCPVSPVICLELLGQRILWRDAGNLPHPSQSWYVLNRYLQWWQERKTLTRYGTSFTFYH